MTHSPQAVALAAQVAELAGELVVADQRIERADRELAEARELAAKWRGLAHVHGVTHDAADAFPWEA